MNPAHEQSTTCLRPLPLITSARQWCPPLGPFFVEYTSVTHLRGLPVESRRPADDLGVETPSEGDPRADGGPVNGMRSRTHVVDYAQTPKGVYLRLNHNFTASRRQSPPSDGRAAASTTAPLARSAPTTTSLPPPWPEQVRRRPMNPSPVCPTRSSRSISTCWDTPSALGSAWTLCMPSQAAVPVPTPALPPAPTITQLNPIDSRRRCEILVRPRPAKLSHRQYSTG